MIDRLKKRLKALWNQALQLIRLLRFEKDALDNLLIYLKREENKASVSKLKCQTGKVLREVMPRGGTGYLKLGFDDPSATGKAMEAAALLYPYYAGKVEVIPVFGESALEADLQLKGRVHIGVLLFIALRLYLDKNLRRMYRHLRRELHRMEAERKKVWAR